MDEIQDATLSEEINRLHAEHRRYAQRLGRVDSETVPLRQTNSSKKYG